MKLNSMKKENKVLIVSMFINFIITIIKIIGGILGGCNSLLADGLHTGSDFITDIIAMIGSIISRKKANKLHPFGYGRSEYIAGTFMGMIIFMLGIFILVRSFLEKSDILPFWLIPVIIITILLKIISIYLLNKIGKNLKSNLLISSATESLTDLYSSVIVILIVILSRVPFLSCIDFIGTIGIAIFILFTAFKILKENILALLGSVEENEALLTNIKIELKAIKNVEIKDIELFKYGFYYQANLKIKISSSMNVLKLINLEKKIQKIVKKKKYGIKYVNIEICT